MKLDDTVIEMLFEVVVDKFVCEVDDVGVVVVGWVTFVSNDINMVEVIVLAVVALRSV